MPDHQSDKASTEGNAPTRFAHPADDRWLEDYVPGDVHEFGDILVDEQELLEFGRRYDPQPFHADPLAARETVFGGLITSGWQTASLMMRAFCDHYLSTVASLSSPGIDELRWLHPVKPGDRLRVRATVASARVSRSKPDRGIVQTDIAVSNDQGKTVMTLKAMNLFACRPKQ